jgi:hypothetical protein
MRLAAAIFVAIHGLGHIFTPWWAAAIAISTGLVIAGVRVGVPARTTCLTGTLKRSHR